MKRIVTFLCGLCAVMAILMTAWNDARLASSATAAIPSAPVQTVTAVPLYRLYKIAVDPAMNWPGHVPGLHFYTTDVNERDYAVKNNRYRDEGIAGYVLPQKAHGTVPLFRLSSVSRRAPGEPALAAKYFYSTNKAYVDKLLGQGWKLDGIAGHVAPDSNPLYGTVPFYRVYRPQTVNPESKYTGHYHTGDDDNFYTTDFAEKDRAIAHQGYRNQGVACFIWSGPTAVALGAPPKSLPDLVVAKSTVEGVNVHVVIENRGTHNIGPDPGVDVLFLILERNGKQIYSSIKTLGGMSPGQGGSVTFDTGNHNLLGRVYQIKIDHQNKVEESNESNNNTTPTSLLKLKINPLPADYVTPPSFRLVAVQPSPTASQPKRTIYKLDVSNWDKFKPEWFQSMENVLPPNPCGGGNTHARLIASFIVIKNEIPRAVGCKPLNSPADLRTLEYAIPVTLGDADKIKIAVVDTALDVNYVSQPYPVGVFGVGKILTTVGCKFFLGREGSYICSTDQGFNACENLRNQGKPIECRRAAKPQ